MTQQPHQPDSLEGLVLELASPAERQKALDQAFDYRGDVSIHLADGQVIEGYIFDRRGGDEPCVRLMPTAGSQTVQVDYAQITRVTFSGRDPAAGKSWETWLKNYYEKKTRGEAANRHPDPLD